MADRLFADTRLAELYDAFCGTDERADLRFYLPRVMAARSVLDVGCGTGALLRRARDEGHAGRLCGVDPAPGMLAQARRRPDVEWILGDLRTVRFEEAFDLVVMTGHAFQVWVEDEELRHGLAAIRAALTKAGRFAFETRNPNARAWEHWTPEHVAEATDSSGAVVRMQREVEAVDGDRVRFTHTFTSPAWDRPERSRSTLRFLSADSLGTFLGEAGLVAEGQFGDFGGSPLGDASPEIITVARRA